MMTLEAGAATYIGQRQVNADAFLVDAPGGLYAVADGVGDTPRAAVAAQRVLHAARDLFRDPWTQYAVDLRPADEAAGRLQLGVMQAHDKLYAPWRLRAEQDLSTFAGVVVSGNDICYANVGDSRIYLLQNSKGRLAQISRDHTVACDAHQRGVPRDEAASLPHAHALTQVLGAASQPEIRTHVRRWEAGDVILLCTDGVSDCIAADELVEILLDSRDLTTTAERLVHRAGEAGSLDNRTAILVRRAS
jgi:serine/threonine protein phosphatase PrpC